MAWKGSYDFTPRGEESEFDSSDESDSEGGTETLKLYHRRKSTVTAVRSRVRFYSLFAAANIYKPAKNPQNVFELGALLAFFSAKKTLWSYCHVLFSRPFSARIINLEFCSVYKTQPVCHIVVRCKLSASPLGTLTARLWTHCGLRNSFKLTSKANICSFVFMADKISFKAKFPASFIFGIIPMCVYSDFPPLHA